MRSLLLWLILLMALWGKGIRPPVPMCDIAPCSDRGYHYDANDHTLTYLENGKPRTRYLYAESWLEWLQFDKNATQSVRKKIAERMKAEGYKAYAVDAEQDLYIKEEPGRLLALLASFDRSESARLAYYLQRSLPAGKARELTLENETALRLDMDGAHYYYLDVEVLEGKGADMRARLERLSYDAPYGVHVERKLSCMAAYESRCVMADLPPYKAVYSLRLDPDGKTRLRLRWVRTNHRPRTVITDKEAPGIVRIDKGGGRAFTLHQIDYFPGTYNSHIGADRLPDGSATAWLANGLYRLESGLYESQIVPVAGGMLTQIMWPLLPELNPQKEQKHTAARPLGLNLYAAAAKDEKEGHIDFSVSGLPAGLEPTPKDLAVYEAGAVKGTPLRLERLQTPLDVVILLDSSGSMKRSMKMARAQVARFIQKLPADARIRLVDFDTRVKWLKAKDRKSLLKKLKKVRANGATALYDALIAGTKRLASSPRGAVVLFTDGKDANYNDTRRGSKATFEQMLAALRRNRVPVFPVAFGKGADEATLKAVAKMSGTRYWRGDDAGALERIFGEIAGVLSHAYRLHYARGKVGKKGVRPVVQFMIDMSGSQDLRHSMSRDCEGCGYRLEAIKRLLMQSIDELPEKSLIQLAVFNTEVRVPQVVTEDKAALLYAVGTLEAGGGTDILKAVQKGYELSRAVPSQRRYFLFLTDAAADAFKFNEDEKKSLFAALDAFRREGVQTLWLGIVDSKKARKWLKELARRSGGEAFVSGEIAKIAQKTVAFCQKVRQNAEPPKNAGSVTLRLAMRDNATGELFAGEGRRELNATLPVAQNAPVLEGVRYDMSRPDRLYKRYGYDAAQAIYGDEKPFKEVVIDRVLPLGENPPEGNNSAVRMRITRAVLLKTLHGIDAPSRSNYLALEVSMENILKPVTVLGGGGHPSDTVGGKTPKSFKAIPAYQIPDPARHLFVRYNDTVETPPDPLTPTLAKPFWFVDAPAVTVPPKKPIRGVMLFVVPDEPLERLSLHLYDTAYGHIDLPIVGKIGRSKARLETLPRSTPAKLSDAFSLMVTGRGFEETAAGVEAREGGGFVRISGKIQSRLNALLAIRPRRRIRLEIPTDSGVWSLPPHPLTERIPFGLYGLRMFAPGSDNRFDMLFESPQVLRDAPARLRVELKGEDVILPLSKPKAKTASSKPLAVGHGEGVELRVNALYCLEYEKKRCVKLAADVTLADTPDDHGTRLHDMLRVGGKAAATEKRGNGAVKKGLGNFASASTIRRSENDVGIDEETEALILGCDGEVFDGVARRCVALFDLDDLKAEDPRLYSPIFADLALPLSRAKKATKAFRRLLIERCEVPDDSRAEEVAAALDAARERAANRPGPALPVVTPSGDPVPPYLAPLPATVAGMKRMEAITSAKEALAFMKKIRYIPGKSVHQGADAVATRRAGNPEDMANLLLKLLRRVGFTPKLGYVELSDKGRAVLQRMAGTLPVRCESLPYVQWRQEGRTRRIVLPFLKTIEALKGMINKPGKADERIDFSRIDMSMTLRYSPGKSDAKAQMGAMGSALSGGSGPALKSDRLFAADFDENLLTRAPVEVWFTKGQDEKGREVWVAHWHQGGHHAHALSDVPADAKPVSLELDVEGVRRVYRFKKNERLDGRIWSLAYRLCNLDKEATKALEEAAGDRLADVKDMAPLAKAQWALRAGIYRFVAMQTAFEKKMLPEGVAVSRGRRPRVIFATATVTRKGKVTLALDLRQVDPEVYGEAKKVRGFHVATGFFAAEAEGRAFAGGKSLFDVWDLTKQGVVVLDPDNKEALAWLKTQKVPEWIQKRFDRSDRYWLFPLQYDTLPGWIEVDPDTYRLRTVMADGSYGAASEYVAQTAQDLVNAYMFGALAGVNMSIFSISGYIIAGKDFCEALKEAESLAGNIACAVSVLSGFKSGKKVLGKLTGAASAGLGCQEYIGAEQRIWSYKKVHSFMLQNKIKDAAEAFGGFANGFADAVTYFFLLCKTGSGCY
ncbi:MAG: VWA domain-containing protein [Epsilonproteobacteria bacterium]|nr:VWA domain-containing protein [Campylobacterota bacterium]